MAEGYENGYGKRPLWQWFLIYAVVGLVAYGLVYYFVFSKKGETINNAPSIPPAASSEATSSATVSQDAVTLTANGFSPASITVKAGTKVTWNNQSGAGAIVNSDPHPIHTAYPPLNLGSFKDGGTLSLTFDKSGTYGYHNHLNPSQTGTVIVQ